MTEQQLHLSIPQSAQDARHELRQALKNADNPAGWMDFMESVTRLMPEVLSTGRPSAEVIEASPIGQLGFKSWAEMIESPDGLKWNVSGWKAWRRAWAVVQEHPWLRSEALTSSEVNTLARTFNPFPATPQELSGRRAEQQKVTEQSKAQTIAELRQEVESGKEVIGALMRQLNENMEYSKEEAKEMGSLQAQLDKANAELSSLQAQLNKANAELAGFQTSRDRPALSRLGHLKAFIFGV